MIVMQAGPPSALMFDAPTVGLSCGTHSTLAEQRVNATDDYGNKTSASFEVTACPVGLDSCPAFILPFLSCVSHASSTHIQHVVAA